MSCCYQIIGCGLLLVSLSSCGTSSKVDNSLPDYQIDYKKTTELPPLEVPPGLTDVTPAEQLEVPTTDSGNNAAASAESQPVELSTPAHRPTSVLPLSDQVRLQRQGNSRWLLISVAPETIWPKVKIFWAENGFTLKLQAPKIGIMETEWAENRADIPQNGLRKIIGKVLDSVYSASTRDKFRVRLEPGETAGTTELYLTHKGAEEVTQGEGFVWQSRPVDPELEAEMLNRLMVYLGASQPPPDSQVTAKKTKDQPVPSEAESKPANLTLTAEGQMELLVPEDFASAWQRTGLALDRVGFTVEDRDRERGIYFIRYLDPSSSEENAGLFAKIFGTGDQTNNHEEYLIKVKAENTQSTRISVLDKQGQADTSKTAHNILTLLQEQF